MCFIFKGKTSKRSPREYLKILNSFSESDMETLGKQNYVSGLKVY